jgi:hypothetical protein
LADGRRAAVRRAAVRRIPAWRAAVRRAAVRRIPAWSTGDPTRSCRSPAPGMFPGDCVPLPRCGRGAVTQSCLRRCDALRLAATRASAAALATGVTDQPRLRWSGGGQGWRAPLLWGLCGTGSFPGAFGLGRGGHKPCLAGPGCHQPRTAALHPGGCADGRGYRGRGDYRCGVGRVTVLPPPGLGAHESHTRHTIPGKTNPSGRADHGPGTARESRKRHKSPRIGPSRPAHPWAPTPRPVPSGPPAAWRI